MKKVVSVQDLINRKEELTGVKKATYQVDSPIGVLLVKTPTQEDVGNALELSEGNDAYFISETVIEPNFKDKELRKAYGVETAPEVVEKIFTEGQIASLGRTIMKIGGYGENYDYKLYKEAKN